MTVRCEIVAQGRAEERLAAAVDGLDVVNLRDGTWRMAGEVHDRAALVGVLAHLHDLGFALVSVDTEEG